jgi:hypothetical protein
MVAEQMAFMKCVLNCTADFADGPFKIQKGIAMRRIFLVAICAVSMNRGLLFGQGMTLVGSGYAVPQIRVAPGQITTIFVSGLNVDTTKPQRATSLPLPTSLAGISVQINQSSPMQSFAVPLLSVQQLNTCSNGGAPPASTVPSDCLVGAIALQIPYDLIPDSKYGTVPGVTELVITAKGVASKAFAVTTGTDNLHVLRPCDDYPSVGGLSQTSVDGGCNSVVTHADGTDVDFYSPAKPGEVVVIYAYGLGQTGPLAKTGEASPSPAPVLAGGKFGPIRTVGIQFDFRPNAAPSNPSLTFRAVTSTNPPPLPFALPPLLFVGLTPGQVGLYQINVQLPSTFPDIEPCGSPAVGGSVPFVRSNLTIDIGGVSSFDGAAICVQPAVPEAIER